MPGFPAPIVYGIGSLAFNQSKRVRVSLGVSWSLEGASFAGVVQRNARHVLTVKIAGSIHAVRMNVLNGV